ncbi:MAG: hypothetical protein ABII79_09670 [bacterium]
MLTHLDPKDNREFFDIITASNSVMDEWNNINNELSMHTSGPFYSWNRKRELKKLAKRFGDLQRQWLEDQKAAIRFAVNPQFTFPADTDSSVAFNLNHRLLLDRVNQLRSDMIVLTTNFNIRMAEVEHSRDFTIAIVSAAMGFAGLAMSLLYIFLM